MSISGIGKRIISLREHRDWSQRELAKRVGINPSVMNRIELEDRPIKDYELDLLASVLETTTDYLLGRELNEDRAAYKSLEHVGDWMEFLGTENFPLHIVNELHHIKSEDREEIRKHIEYIIYRAKNRENNNNE